MKEKKTERKMSNQAVFDRDWNNNFTVAVNSVSISIAFLSCLACLLKVNLREVLYKTFKAINSYRKQNIANRFENTKWNEKA